MKIALSKTDEEDLETQNFVKFKSNKRKLTGKQSVTQLVSRRENYADPDAKFENADLNELSRMGFLDELITGIKTGKEASVYLGRNSTGLVAVKMYTDLRVRSFKRDASYREGPYWRCRSKKPSNREVKPVSTPIRFSGCRKSSTRCNSCTSAASKFQKPSLSTGLRL